MGGKRAKNSPKWKIKLHLSCILSQEQCSIWSWFLVHLCKLIISPGVFPFHFFKVFIFWVFRVLKGQKMVQNDKKFCLSLSISQEPCIIWLSFIVHICKMIICSGIFFFHFFKILIFQVVRGVNVQKMVQNYKKFCPSHSISQELYIIWLSFMVHMCKMIISPDVFFHFFKVLIFWFVSG